MWGDAGDGQVHLDLVVEVDAPLPAGVSEASLQALLAFALTEEGHGGAWELSLLFTTDARIQVMHHEFMGLDSPTDIMTFPYEADEFSPAAASSRGGDIVMSIETAAANALDAGWSLPDELFFLVLHGLLHILGWDDGSVDERASMLARQSRLLEGWRDQAGAATG